MENSIPTIALLIGCGDDLKQRLCRQFRFPDLQVTVTDGLDGINSRFKSTRFEFIAINRDLLAEKNGTTDETLRQLANQTPMLMIVDTNGCLCDPEPTLGEGVSASNGTGHPTHESMQFSEYLPMIEHASRNVLQQINLLINEIEIATRGDEAVGQSLSQIETANQQLRNHIHVLRGISEPIELKLEDHRVDDLLNSIWRELKVEGRSSFGVQIELKCQPKLALDYERIKSAVRSVFDFFSSVVEPGSTIYLSDEMTTIEGEPFLQIRFEAATIAWDRKPSFELALCRRIFELHGGRVDFENVDQEKIACKLILPTPVQARL